MCRDGVWAWCTHNQTQPNSDLSGLHDMEFSQKNHLALCTRTKAENRSFSVKACEHDVMYYVQYTVHACGWCWRKAKLAAVAWIEQPSEELPAKTHFVWHGGSIHAIASSDSRRHHVRYHGAAAANRMSHALDQGCTV